MAKPSRLGNVRVHTGDRLLDDVQTAARATARVANACPFLRGVLTPAQTITTASKTYDHGLGRQPSGCIVLAANTPIAVAFPNAQPPDTSRQSNLTASAAGIADLWWF